MIRILLTAEDFKLLVAGQVVEKQAPNGNVPIKIEFALQDIGYNQMVQILWDEVQNEKKQA
jgi:hypothetical protein